MPASSGLFFVCGSSRQRKGLAKYLAKLLHQRFSNATLHPIAAPHAKHPKHSGQEEAKAGLAPEGAQQEVHQRDGCHVIELSARAL